MRFVPRRLSSAPAARVFRGVGRAADLGHPLGVGARRHRGRRRRLPASSRPALGKNRIIADPLEVPRRAPDIIFGSWCGKKFRPASVAARRGGTTCRPCVTRSLRGEVVDHPAARPGGADRRVRELQRGLRRGPRSGAERSAEAFVGATRPEVFRRAVRDMDVAAGAPMDGFTASRRKTTGRVGAANAYLARSHRMRRTLTRYAVSRRSASAYFSLVCRMTSAGSCGPGAVLFQSSVSR